MKKKLDDKELKNLFQASKKEMANGDFSMRVMRNLPQKQTSFEWVYILVFSIFTWFIGFFMDWNKLTETILSDVNNIVRYFNNFSMSLPNDSMIFCGLFLAFLCVFFLIIKHKQLINYLF